MRTLLPLASALETRTSIATLQVKGEDGLVRCTACAHRCVVAEGRAGACGVRVTRNGSLRAPNGYVARTYVRPIETNTVYHVLPGTKALTFGMFGCDLRCGYCHNWKVSQALREPREDEAPRDATPEQIVETALQNDCRAICAAYNEPMIAAEWVRDIFTVARERGLKTVIVSDGHSTPEALDFVRPVTDVFRVDLKAFDAAQYRSLGGRLEPVLDSIRGARERGLWVEVVTLVVPGFNDAPTELRALIDWLVALGPEIPWHVNAFQPRYKMTDRPTTSATWLTSIAGLGYGRGLRHVYVGNVHATMPELEHTRCPGCHATVVERQNYAATHVRVVDGACASCGARIAGLWS